MEIKWSQNTTRKLGNRGAHGEEFQIQSPAVLQEWFGDDVSIKIFSQEFKNAAENGQNA